MTAPCSPNAKSTARRVKCPPSSRSWSAWTLPVSYVTADALHTQRDHASFLVGRGADYLLVVKANQPTLHAQLAELPVAADPGGWTAPATKATAALRSGP